MCVSVSSTTFLRNILLVNIEPHMINMYIGPHENYPLLLSDFNEN